MFIPIILSALVAAPAVWSHPGLTPRAVPQVVYGCQNANQIAMTFDDGPYIYLRQISDAFTAANASATFFMNGNNWACVYDPARVSDVQHAFKAGHMIGSHTWGHTDLTANNLTSDQMNDQLYRMELAFSRMLGVKPAFMRPPYGNYNDDVLSVMSSRGQSAAMWDTDTGDADGNNVTTSEGVYDQVANANLPNALILEHETEKTTAEQLVPYAINLFQSKGYKLVTLADCIGAQPYQAVGVAQQRDASPTSSARDFIMLIFVL
ncbi:chitin deacetylase [Mycena sanguinolenta]|nr:chitin deacetylase [Mycena sanguinolenta]